MPARHRAAVAALVLLAAASPTAAARATRVPHHTAGTTYDVVDVVVDADGARHVRLDRRYRGLRVVGGDLVTHYSPAGRVTGVTHASPRPVAVGTAPRVPATVAAVLAGQPGARAELVVDARRTPPVLAWDVGDDRHVLVDARDGRVLSRWETAWHANGTGHGYYTGTVPLRTTPDGGGYVLRDPSRGGFRTVDGLHAEPLPALDLTDRYPDFRDADNRWGDGTLSDRATVAADVHYAGARTWDYLRAAFRRSGLDGKGGSFVLVVHRGPVGQASWSDGCRCAWFSDGNGVTYGPVATIDLVGHELGHGLVGATARLQYEGEAGALNEVTGDILGTLVEHFANNAEDRPDYVWGDGIATDGSFRRPMDDPSRGGLSGCWSPGVADTSRYAGIGVGAHFFYLLAVGSGRSRWGDSPTCNDAPGVRGIGNAAAGAIWYRALTVYMTSTTDYAGARVATLRAVRDLHGRHSAAYRAVAAAWHAVGVG